MLDIEKRYVVDENNRKVAVEIDYETFLKIEEILEDHALYHLMEEADNSEALMIGEARQYYNQLLEQDGDKV